MPPPVDAQRIRLLRQLPALRERLRIKRRVVSPRFHPEQDLNDVCSMLEAGLVEPSRIRALYDAIEPDLYRYPG
jgi:hypothetical protein